MPSQEGLISMKLVKNSPIIGQCTVNMKIPAPKSVAIHMNPQEENGIFSKTASVILIQFQ
jgi:hypothetical protein